MQLPRELPQFEPVPGTDYVRLTADYIFYIPGTRQRMTIPRGFVCDFASVPPRLQRFVPVYGSHATAALVHDWLCADVRMIIDHADVRRPMTVAEKDAAMVAIMDADGVDAKRVRRIRLGLAWSRHCGGRDEHGGVKNG